MVGMTMVKMAAVSEITLLLLCCFVITSTDSQNVDCHRYAATGEDFTVPLKYQLTDTERLIWIRDQTHVVERKPVMADGKVVSQKFFVGSAKDISPNGSLELTNVSQVKAGSYRATVHNVRGESVFSSNIQRVCVLDRVAPKVETVCHPPDVKFTCKVVQTKGVTFEWLQNDKPMDGKSAQLLRLEAKAVEKNSFSCRVSNQLGPVTSAPVTDPCPAPGFVFPEEVMGFSIWIFVGGGGGIVLVLIIVVIICCVRAKRKKRMHIQDEEELRLGWTNPEQQPACPQHGQTAGRHHHHQQHQQPAGHTGPRQHRPKQPREHRRPRAHDPPAGQPQPSPRIPAQTPIPQHVNGDDEKPPPLPQPRKITHRV